MRLLPMWTLLVAALAGCATAVSRTDGGDADARADGAEQSAPDTRPPALDEGADTPPPPDVPVPTAAFGEPCTRDDECVTGLCITGPGLIGGCGARCASDADCEPYGSSYNCAVDRPPGGTARYTCAAAESGTALAGAACRTDGDCVTNLCIDGSCRGPCADDAACPAGLRCGDHTVAGASLRTCRATPVAGVTVEDYVLFEGAARTDATTPVFPVVLPPDVVSVTFAIEDLEGNDLLVSVSNVQAPDGAMWINARTWNGIADQPVRELMFNRQVNSALAPSSDTLRVRPGRYAVNFSVVNPRGATTPVPMRRVRCTARIKRAPAGALTAGTVRLRVVLVGAPGGMTAATAGANARLQSSLATVNTIFGAVGLRAAVEGYSEIAGAEGTRLGTIDSRDELGELLATSRGTAAGDVLSLFIIRGIAAGAGLENAIGVAGDIVGPAGIHGTLDSGVVAAWDTTMGRPDLLPQVLAHECGHYLGLWHTRESRAGCTMPGQMDCSPFGGVDPITDTPTDDATSRTYLMHWFTNGTNNRVSPGQGTVLRAHALVR